MCCSQNQWLWAENLQANPLNNTFTFDSLLISHLMALSLKINLTSRFQSLVNLKYIQGLSVVQSSKIYYQNRMEMIMFPFFTLLCIFEYFLIWCFWKSKLKPVRQNINKWETRFCCSLHTCLTYRLSLYIILMRRVENLSRSHRQCVTTSFASSDFRIEWSIPLTVYF